ncbi:MAG: FitA-like ribbon-helix-helix domain-containing protein [Cyanobacteriota bacterium]|jgi:plasmid stability protein
MATLTLHDVPEELVARLEERAHAHGRSLNSEAVDCLMRQATAGTDVEAWLRDVATLRSQITGGPIPLDELVAATERDSH